MRIKNQIVHVLQQKYIVTRFWISWKHLLVWLNAQIRGRTEVKKNSARKIKIRIIKKRERIKDVNWKRNIRKRKNLKIKRKWIERINGNLKIVKRKIIKRKNFELRCL
jgi:hypothetical protein